MHKMKLFGGVAVAAVIFAMPAMAADTLKYGPAETWVKPLDLPKPDDAYSGAPAQILLHNLQVNFDANGDTVWYTEIAVHIQTAAGLQLAQPYVIWNPDTDTATANSVRLIRGDQVIDVLKSQTFTTLRREQNLDRAMLDGVLTGVMQPEGMQVGDTLIFAFTIRRHDPTLGGRGEMIADSLSGGPVVHQQVRAIWDPAHPIHWQQSEDLSGKVVKSATGDSFVMDRMHVTEPQTQADAPARFNRTGTIEFTQFGNWSEISTLMAPLYAKASTLSTDSPLRKEVATIKAATSDPKAQAAMALRLVENQVRYVFLGMNFGGYVPADADATWQRRFGDCKGKTALLLALLHELGIKAVPAVVSTVDNDGMDQRLPALELFNHVMVRAEIDGKTYWLDGTRLGDRDLDGLAPPAVRWALPLTPEGATLEAVKMTPPDKPTEETFLRLDASAGLDVPAQAHAEKTIRGDDAVQFDMAYSALAVPDRDKQLKAYWTQAYDWITPSKVSATFDAATGEERLTMDGPAAMEWTAGDDGKTWRYETDIMGVGWSSAEKRDGGPHKDAPILINFPYFEKTREEILLPKGGKDFTLDGNPVDKTLGGAEFKRTLAIKDGKVELESSKRAVVPEISYADAVAQSPALTAMWKNDVHLVAPKSYRKADPKAAKTDTAQADAVPGSPKTTDELLADATQMRQQNKPDQALADYNKVLATEPTNVQALCGRGVVFVQRGTTASAAMAAADFELAVKTDPTSWQALNGLGTSRFSQGRYDEAIDAFTKGLAIYPNDGYAYEYRARAYLAKNDKDKARADAAAAHDLAADATEVVLLQVDIALADRKPEEARDILRQAIAGNADDMSLHARLASLLENCNPAGDDACVKNRALAVAEYDTMIAAKPSAWAYAMRANARPATDRQKALDDIDAAMKLEPQSTMPLRARASLYEGDKAYDKALADLKSAQALDAKDVNVYGMRARIYFEMNKPDLALADVDTIKHDHAGEAWVYNQSCWERGTHNTQLDVALADCDTVVKMAPAIGGYLDSRALVKYRMGRFDDALADYNAALALQPDIPGSLYVRGLIKLKKGDKAGGKADIAAAQKIQPKVADEFAGYGVKP